MNCKDLIEELELTPHPEGGYFKETYRASDSVNYKGGRACRFHRYLLPAQ